MKQENELSIRENWVNYIHQLQKNICIALENIDGKSSFITDEWKRKNGDGGGGITRVIENGKVFEKGGVNTSVVYGEVTENMKALLNQDASSWFAAGLSLVIHPVNPFVPTVHANWRYFELYDENKNIVDCWFGGGADLTPYYLFEEDVIHFHQTLKNAMDPFGKSYYPLFKKNCDAYFTNTHRENEMRGVGGVFYDHQRGENYGGIANLFIFQQANGNAFIDAYLPIVSKRMNSEYGPEQTNWQEIRRGRYVEFNLIHDRGTLFGLKTQGRTESILMSLPPRAQWIYNFQPSVNSEEHKLLQACKHPRDWLRLEEISEEDWAEKANSC